MSSDSRGGEISRVDDALSNDMSSVALEQQLSDSDESGSSYIGSGMPSPPGATICRWRTDRFRDQECERFFDCPTHIVERSLSSMGTEEPGDPNEASANSEREAGPSNTNTQRETAGDAPDPVSVPIPESSESRQEAGLPSINDVQVQAAGVYNPSRGQEPGIQDDDEEPPSHTTTNSNSDEATQKSSNEDGEDHVEEEYEPTNSGLLLDPATPAIPTQGGRLGAIISPPPPRSSSLPRPQPIERESSVDATSYPPPTSPPGEEEERDTIYSPQEEAQPSPPPPPPAHSPPPSPPPSSSPPLAATSQQTSSSSTPVPGRRATFNTLDDVISTVSEPRTGPSIPQQTFSNIQDRRANQEDPAPPRDIILPRWQPDNEVTFCPICRTQFSIFVRKHHCRKCGRVVCNSCSPHRIVIPYQFIVQPPGQPRRHPSYSGGGGLNLGGGERVRLCNPCVPDPNTTPPQTQRRGPVSPYSPRSPPGHNRTQSSSHHPGAFQASPGPIPPLGRISPLFSSRNRSVTLTGPQSQYSTTTGIGAYGTQYHHHRSRENRILSGTPPTPRSDYLHGPDADALRHIQQHGSLMDVRGGGGGQRSSSRAGPSSGGDGSSSRYYQIPEEDECPVCHRELPSRGLPDAETHRESHITMCIQTHSQYGGGSGRRGSGGGGGGRSPASTGGGSGGMGMGTTASTSIRRATGMFPYRATEKDCVDSAECTICLEEFEVGVPMARLECLCRFHKACIMAWWKNHPGRCPVHQHDAFGF